MTEAQIKVMLDITDLLHDEVETLKGHTIDVNVSRMTVSIEIVERYLKTLKSVIK